MGQMFRKLLIIFVVLLATSACSDSKSLSNKHICVPSGSESAGEGETMTDAGGNEIQKLEEIEKYLKEQKIISTIVGEIRGKLLGEGEFGSAQLIFIGLVSNPSFITAIGAAFSLYVIIFGVSVLGGLVQVTVGEAAIRIAKLAFVSTVAMNWGEFYALIGSFFVDTMDELIKFFLESFKELYYTTPDLSFDKDVIFKDLDVFVSRVFSPHSFALLAALGSSTEGNITWAALIGFSLYFLMMGIFRVVVTYIWSLFALSLLFALAPIFIAFLLFSQTKTMFDNWLNQMISYVLQPVMVCAFLGMYVGLLGPFLQDLLQYKVCFGPTGTATEGNAWCFVNPEDPANQCVPFSASSESPISIQSILLFFVFSWMFGANVKFAAEIAAGLSPAFAADLTKGGAWKQMLDANPNKDGLMGMLGRQTKNS